MSSKDLLADLKSKIGQQMKSTPPATEAAPAPRETAPARVAHKKESSPKAAPAKEAVALPARSGRGVHMYLDDTDRKILHTLAVWFASNDRRVSDSQVIKAALRMAEGHQGAKLLELCDQVRATDRRKQPRKPDTKAEK